MEELNKYLSGLTEHHDMYVLVSRLTPMAYIDDLPPFLGRKSDPVDSFPSLPLGLLVLFGLLSGGVKSITHQSNT